MHDWMLEAPMLSPTVQDVAIGTTPWCVRSSVPLPPARSSKNCCASPRSGRAIVTSENRETPLPRILGRSNQSANVTKQKATLKALASKRQISPVPNQKNQASPKLLKFGLYESSQNPTWRRQMGECLISTRQI